MGPLSAGLRFLIGTQAIDLGKSNFYAGFGALMMAGPFQIRRVDRARNVL